MDSSKPPTTRQKLSLAGLPADILCLVFEQLPFDDHFAFISTCKQLYFRAEYILHRHRDAHAKWSDVSDLEPTTILTLLDKAFGNDPLPAWHLRSLQIWRDRTSWPDWMTYDPSAPPNPTSQAGLSDTDILKLQPSLSKVGGYLDWFDERAHEGMYGDWDYKSRALRQVESGHDGVLKALLIARCPRLREVKFVPRAADKETGSSLWWLKTLISISKCIGKKMHRPFMGDSESDTEDDSEVEAEEEEEEDEGEEKEEEEIEEEEEKEEDERKEYGEEWGRQADRTIAEEGDALQEVDDAPECCELFLDQGQDDRLPKIDSNFEREWEAEFARWQENQRSREAQSTDEKEDEPVCVARYGLGHSGSKIKSDTKDKAAAPPECPGFISLRYVSIGVVSNTWMDDDEYPCSLRLLGRLLKFPKLDTLYFNGLRCDGSEHFGENADNTSREDSMISVLDYDCIEPNSSSVKHLYLEGLDSDLCRDVREMLFEAPRELHTAAFRHHGQVDEQADTAAIVRHLTLTQGASLRNLMFYNYQCATTNYEKGTLFRLYDFYNKFSDLRKVTFNTRDFATSWKKQPPPAESFPRSLERLVLLDAGSGAWTNRNGGVVLLEQVLVKMIESGRYENLKEVFIEGLGGIAQQGDGNISLDKAVAAGKEKGVAVCMSTNEISNASSIFLVLTAD